MEEMNACGCGYTTNNPKEFQTHIEEHEKTTVMNWSGEVSPSTSPRGSTDSGISSTSDDLSQKLPESTMLSEALPTNVFLGANPFAKAFAALTATSGNNEKLPILNQHTEAVFNLNATSSQQQQSEESSPEAPPKSNSSLTDEGRNNNNKGTKSEKVMHSCPHCNFTTVMSQHMKSHLEAHERHQGSMYQCDICHMQFSQKANMHRHRMRHSGVKPYECRYCFKKFFRKDQMQEHSMTHIKTGDDFDCPVADCNQQFSQHSALRIHLDEHHVISATQQASCKRCSLLFANSRRLLLHYQTKHDDIGDNSKGNSKEESSIPTDFNVLSNMDLKNAMQLFTGTQTNNSKPPAKKRRTNGVKANSVNSTPVTPIISSLNSSAALAATMARYSDMLPLDMSKRISPTTSITPPTNPASVIKFPKIESENEDVIVDVCSTNSDIKKETIEKALSPKLPKAESPDYVKLFSNNYNNLAALRPDLASFLNGGFNPFLMTQKPDPLLWTQDSHVSTTITSVPSSTMSSCGNAADELSASATHSPSAESRSSTDSTTEKEPLECNFCGLVFLDRTLHLLHKGLHSAQDPWKCNLCGAICGDKYVFTSHMISSDHQ